MNRHHYPNTVQSQIRELDALVDVQADLCFDRDRLSGMMPGAIFGGFKRLVITGCGDSFSAAGAIAEAVRMHSGIQRVDVPDPIEFNRFYTNHQLLTGYAPGQVLVVAISASGSSQRMIESLQRGQAAGAHTMLITNNPQSIGAKAAEFVYHLNTPAGCNTPGLRSYFASMIGIISLGAYIGLLNGHVSQARSGQIKQLVKTHVHAFMEGIDPMEEQMFRTAVAWQGFRKFEAIGDWQSLYSAQFVEEKFIECAGVSCMHADSEDWCHIHCHQSGAEHIGTVVMSNRNSASHDRMLYTIKTAVGMQRPTLVVTDDDEANLPAGVVLCRIPSPKELWLGPLTEFIPGTYVAGYIPTLLKKLYFTGRYDYTTQQWA